MPHAVPGLEMNSGSPTLEDVSLAELKQGLADGSILLVDVREPNEWDAGHIAGAILHPMSSFDPDAWFCNAAPAIARRRHLRSRKHMGARMCARISVAACSNGPPPASRSNASADDGVYARSYPPRAAWERGGEPLAARGARRDSSKASRLDRARGHARPGSEEIPSAHSPESGGRDRRVGI